MTANTLPLETPTLSPLATLRQVRQTDRSIGALVLSVAIHSGLVAIIAFASYQLAPPAMKKTVTLYLPRPHGAGAPPIKKGVRHPRPVTKASPPKEQVKTRVPERIPTKPPEAAPQANRTAQTIDEPFTEEGPLGDPLGSDTGSPEGIGPGEGLGDGPGIGVGSVLSPGGEILDVPPTQAHLLKRVEPIYPTIARKAGIHGSVILVAVIGTDGQVENLKVLRSIPMLDQAAIDAVSQWIFEPALRHGHAVRMRLTVSILFRLGR